MFYRGVGGLFALLTLGGLLLAEETRGTITKIESGAITIRTGGGFGFGKKDEKKEPMEKTFKVSADVKITRTVGKDKDEVKLTLDELKTAVKVTNVFVTVVHEGDNGSEIKVGGRGFGTGFGKKKKTEDK
ncbi:MAG: hypothetical protein U0793_17305 [Gemmataceae bacterium]